MMRSRLITGAAVVTAVAAGGVGGALIGVPALSGAQTFPKNATTAASTGSPTGKQGARDSALLDAAAKALKLTTQQLRDKLSDGKTTIADVAKQQNVDINAVIDAIAAADRGRISNIVNNPWPKFGANGGPGKGFARGFDRGGFGFIGDEFGAAAKALGISTAELKTDLGKGQSIADIAKAKKLDVNTVIDALVADAKSKIDQAVKDGDLTQAEADKIETTLKTSISGLVNNTMPKGPNGAGPFAGGEGRFGNHGHGGYDGPDSGTNNPSTIAPPTTAPTS
jgi:hypothetical protein